MTRILGVSCNYHDAAAALVVDGEIVAAAEEERFSRRKHDPSVPFGVFSWMRSDLGVSEVDEVVFYERPLAKLDRVQTMRRGRWRGGRLVHDSVRQWAGSLLWVEADLRGALAAAGIEFSGRVSFTDHHHSHAASAFYASPFAEAAVLCLDGVGEWATSSVCRGDGVTLERLREGFFPHSLGLLYATFTSLAGFKVNSGEYKLMGLAPYGEPRFLPVMQERIARLDDDGGVELDLSFFGFLDDRRMFSPKLCELLFGSSTPPPMIEDGAPSPLACDLAASAQAFCDEAVLRSARLAVRLAGSRNLALAGGVALNCVSTGRLLSENVCDEVFVQPAASDAGGALGCALARAAELGELTRSWVPVRDAMRGGFLGPVIGDAEVRSLLEEFEPVAEFLPRPQMDVRIAELLADGALVGVARGACEFGPRALGNRSILADPRRPDVQRVLNMAVKQRESFRPFAPAVLSSHVDRWFLPPHGSPFMTVVASLREEHRLPFDAGLPVFERVSAVRSPVPAVTHVDYSARVQTVAESDPLGGVLVAFEALTGVPMVVNTSFNRRGEPIVRSAFEAYRCFHHADLTHLVLGDWLISKRPGQRGPEDVVLEAD